MKRFKTDEEAIAALNEDPEAQSLLEDLKRQTPEQIDRLLDSLEDEDSDDPMAER